MQSDESGDRMVDSHYNAEASAFVQDARRALGIKQADLATELAQRLGVPVSQSALSGWETGVRTVPGPVLAAVLELLGHSLASLVTAEAVPPDRASRLEVQFQELGLVVAEAIDAMAARPGKKENVERAHELARRLREITRGA